MGENTVKHPGLARIVLTAAYLSFGLAMVSAKTHELPQADPESLGLSAARLSNIDAAVEAAIAAKEVPGAVVLIARRGSIAFFKAYGDRSVAPSQEPMTRDTIFDMASLTKVMATTPAIMLLVENGALRLDDKVKRYLPKFTGGGKDAITVRQLLTHFSGLRPDFDLSKSWEGYSAALEELWKETTQGEPGKEFVYSDLNFIALGEIVHTISGQTLDQFTHDRVFEPLGMADTAFLPPESWRARIAPTESRASTLAYLKGEGTVAQGTEPLRGEVHDPTAWRMEGVAGHAGLFSSARDVAIYAQMLMDDGIYAGNRIFSKAAVEAMTAAQSPRAVPTLRGFGWDIDTAYSSPRGDLFSGGYGHTGFTGTSLWIHPPTRTFIVVLSNRVHPDGKGDATHLRAVIANIVAAAINDP